jgi:hypothetical protein
VKKVLEDAAEIRMVHGQLPERNLEVNIKGVEDAAGQAQPIESGPNGLVESQRAIEIEGEEGEAKSP